MNNAYSTAERVIFYRLNDNAPQPLSRKLDIPRRLANLCAKSPRNLGNIDKKFVKCRDAWQIKFWNVELNRCETIFAEDKRRWHSKFWWNRIISSRLISSSSVVFSLFPWISFRIMLIITDVYCYKLASSLYCSEYFHNFIISSPFLYLCYVREDEEWSVFPYIMIEISIYR